MTITESDPEEIAAEQARNAQVLDAMREAGQATEEALQDDYFGFEETHQCDLPDKKSYVIHKELNEGDRKNYLNKQNREITVEKVTQNMKLKVESGEERFQLLMAAICGWNLMRKDTRDGVLRPVPCDDQNKRKFLQAASPRIVDIIDKDVRKHNSWLQQDVTVEDIDKQMAELQEMRDAKVKEEAGKVS